MTGSAVRAIALPGEWTLRAACAGSWEEMYPADTGDRSYRGPAKALCAQCPVRLDCLRYAMATERSQYDRFGVWGGLTPDERQELAVAVGLPSGHKHGGHLGPQPINHGTPEGAQAHYRRDEKPCPPCAKANRLASAESRERARAS